MQLLLAHMRGADVIIALDDDDIVAADYLQNALHFIGQAHEGRRMLDVTGFYLDADKNIIILERPRTGNIYLDKAAIMNEGMALLAKNGRFPCNPSIQCYTLISKLS